MKKFTKAIIGLLGVAGIAASIAGCAQQQQLPAPAPPPPYVSPAK